MKTRKMYEVVSMEIILCSQEDVITASGDTNGNFVVDPWDEISFGA